MITRRMFVAGTSAFSTYSLLSGGWTAHAGTESAEALTRRFEEIEAKTGGRLGVAVQDTGWG